MRNTRSNVLSKMSFDRETFQSKLLSNVYLGLAYRLCWNKFCFPIVGTKVRRFRDQMFKSYPDLKMVDRLLKHQFRMLRRYMHYSYVSHSKGRERKMHECIRQRKTLAIYLLYFISIFYSIFILFLYLLFLLIWYCFVPMHAE